MVRSMDERWIDVRTDDGVRLRARIVGGAGPHLLLHHGLASSQRVWDLMLPRLARRFRVVTYDARGHGQSAKPTSGYGFATVTADLLAVARATRLRRPVIAGHSWGAMVALEAAADHPRRVNGAFLVDGGVSSLGSEMTWPEAKDRLAPPHLDGMPLEEFRGMIRVFTADALEVTPEIERIVLSVMRIDRERKIHPHLHRSNHFRILRAIWEQDPVVLHTRLRVPAEALLAHGCGDGEAGWVEAKRRHAATLRAIGAPTRVSWIEGIHDLPLQQPDVVSRRIEAFVRRAVS